MRSVEDAHIFLLCFSLRAGFKVDTDWFLLLGSVLAKTCTCMSGRLTDIASSTAWTCNLIDYTAGDFIRDLHFQLRHERSHLSKSHHGLYRELCFVQWTNKLIWDRTTILHKQKVFGTLWLWLLWCGCGGCFYLLVLFCLDLVYGLPYDGVVKRTVLILF